jgi:VIT1/CCC1 family predicted Fe2+/Mn2+ transporter
MLLDPAPTVDVMLQNRELILTATADGPVPVAVFDLPEAALRALLDALAHVRRAQFSDALEAEAVLALRRSSAVSEALEREPAEQHVLRLDAEQAALASHAVGFYLAERDVEGYQSPEERARIAGLHALAEPLRDVVADLRLAAEHHAPVAA